MPSWILIILNKTGVEMDPRSTPSKEVHLPISYALVNVFGQSLIQPTRMLLTQEHVTRSGPFLKSQFLN